MTTAKADAELIYSTLDDPDLEELVEMFIQELPARLVQLCTSAAASDWAAVGRLAHQLKGAGGSYGFRQLSVRAGALEHAAKHDGGQTAIQQLLNELADLSLRLRAAAVPARD